MAIRQIIEIDEAKCTGCGDCATGCPEGALRIIEGKARMVGENLCDGLGACIGSCPAGAITIVEREAEAYEEGRVMENMVRLGSAVLTAHLEHLAHHGQDTYVREALAWMEERALPLPAEAARAVAPILAAAPKPAPAFALKPLQSPAAFEACPGSAPRRLPPLAVPKATAQAPSALGSWPIQLHLVNPRAPQFSGADLLVAADCTAFSLGGFHATLLEGRSLVIACPKLDQGRDVYVDKLATILEGAASVTLAIMEVPCCSGLLKLLLEARERTSRTDKPAIRTLVLGIGGGVVKESQH